MDFLYPVDFPDRWGVFIPFGFVLPLCIFPASWIFPTLVLLHKVGKPFYPMPYARKKLPAPAALPNSLKISIG